MTDGPAASRRLSMSQLVERTGVPAATIRYYLAEGLLPPPVKAAANRFSYDERHVEVIRLVRLLRERRHLSLDAIGRALPELLPDLLARPEGGAFRPEMWGQLLVAHAGAPRAAAARERLLEAGLVAFSRDGVADVTVDDVCRAAGIAKGSFYRHFSSKDELFFAAATEAGRRVGAAFADQGGDEPLERARAVSVLATSFGPYLPLLLDLAALASQRRRGFGPVLRVVVEEIRGTIGPRLDLEIGTHTRDVFGAALVEAIVRVTGDAMSVGDLVEIAEQAPA